MDKIERLKWNNFSWVIDNKIDNKLGGEVHQKSFFFLTIDAKNL